MRYCCVPFCTSSQRKKQPGGSFHEISADATLREQWLKVISRKDWQPNSTSNYSAVCSLHFLDADFREDTKRRMLKPGTVPSVFPQYPSYLRPAPSKPQGERTIAKKGNANVHRRNQLPKARLKTSLVFVQRSRMCRTQCCPLIAWTCPCVTTAASPLRTSCKYAARPVPA